MGVALMNLEKILIKHYELYPKMQIQDMVKLIYQNEFGGGHLIKNKADSLIRLQEEYHSLRGYSSSHNQFSNNNVDQACHYICEMCEMSKKKKYFERGTKENSDTRDNGDNKESRDIAEGRDAKGNRDAEASEVLQVSGISEDRELLSGCSQLFIDIGNNLCRFDLKVLNKIVAENVENITENIKDNLKDNIRYNLKNNINDNINDNINNNISVIKSVNIDEIDHLVNDETCGNNYSDYEENYEDIYKDKCKYKYIDLATINSFFVNTANSISGNIQSFEAKLEILNQCCKRRILPYSVTEVEDYLKEYKAKGYPAVSHSEIYRFAYSPAYRIVDGRYCKFFEIFCRIDTLLKTKDRVIIAIDGNSGAGKSTLAAFIADVYDDCNIFHMDDFFLTPELRTEERLNEVGGNVDYVRFKKEVIGGLKSGMEFCYRKYDCQQGTFRESVKVIPKRLNIIEGSYSMHPTLRASYDLKIFLHVDTEEQSRRVLKRNGPKMHEIFISRWIPLENRYFTEMRIKEQSDLVFNM
jgi:hypothetical protein